MSCARAKKIPPDSKKNSSLSLKRRGRKWGLEIGWIMRQRAQRGSFSSLASLRYSKLQRKMTELARQPNCHWFYFEIRNLGIEIQDSRQATWLTNKESMYLKDNLKCRLYNQYFINLFTWPYTSFKISRRLSSYSWSESRCFTFSRSCKRVATSFGALLATKGEAWDV